ncbi:oxygen-dependent coproporphyrinogen oxidase [Flaviaesturariibacter aridisoli]|uniref:coproporphyrinogen oxidase n=1 Tax=Flaviaesturariibacter aridisoli TaxID=2545761 RepID=A0A4R4EAD7_9BACT|nr:oxygen-dependent coproporphyrinogen oxidase [Flaviaesturariibacter aridisoli]TCZ74838.1 oxygen-dependent coproporphyrinogen oxidase [Flaviaesturariibacter aridisoli]
MNINQLPPSDIRDRWIAYIHDLQDRICTGLEAEDGKERFREDRWERPEGGGGKTRVIANGGVFEKGGVNTSVVFGEVTDTMRNALKIDGDRWFACGLSLVLHPFNPMVPTVHCNYRMFELYREGAVSDRWFGGGTDLTPFYLFEEDARHFHGTYKEVCDRFDPLFYPRFKKVCDDYFVNSHRNGERRGIGGIFYDHQRPDAQHDLDFWVRFGQACGDAFLPAYVPIVAAHKNDPFTAEQKHWQEIRRGRYTEFNLVHDRGTIFGLKTNGRTESILMSLPPTVRFEYDYQPAPGSPEDELLQACLHPKEWLM